MQESRDRAFNYVTIFRPGENKMIRLADEEVSDISIAGTGRWAVGMSDDAYELQGNLDGQRFQDIYSVDTQTGMRKVIKKRLRWGNAASPDSTKYLFYENRNFWVYDMASGELLHQDGNDGHIHGFVVDEAEEHLYLACHNRVEKWTLLPPTQDTPTTMP